MFNFLEISLSNNLAILIIIIMLFFSLILLTKNKRLKNEIKDLKLEDKVIFNGTKEVQDDIVPIKNISSEIKEENLLNNKVDKNIKNEISLEEKKVKKENVVKQTKSVKRINNEKDLVKNNVQDSFYNLKKDKEINKNEKVNNRNRQVYTRNVLHNRPKITSPVSIDNEQFDIDKLSFNLNEFVRRERNIRMNKGGEEVKRQPSFKVEADNYLNEVSRKMAKELRPQTIELTDYEKDQEENAIISYQELLNVKDKIAMINDDEETIDFIEELKKLRSSLN